MQQNKTAYRFAFWIPALVILYLLVIRCLLLFSYSVDLNHCIEFGFLHFSQLLSRGETLYQNPEEFPFLAVLFTPSYPYLLNEIADLLGYDPVNDIHSLLVAARVVALCCMAVNAYFIYRIFRMLKLPGFYFLGGLAVYLLLITGHFYGARPDAFKTTLFTVFVYAALQYLFFSKSMHAVLAILTGLVAVSFKQDAILNIYIVLLIACVYLRSRKAFLLFSGFTFGLALLLGCFYFVFGKNFFVDIFILNVQETVDILGSMNFKGIGFSILRLSPLLLLIGYHFYKSDKSQPKFERFILILAVILVITTHLSMLRAASFINYAYESGLLIIISAAIALSYMEPLLLRRMKAFSLLALAYLAALFFMNTLIGNYSYSPKQEARFKQEYFAMLEERDEVKAEIGNDVCFFPNIKYLIFYPNQNLIYGHDLHIDRFIEAYFGLHMPSKLSFMSTDSYDVWFTDGRVKYIVADNNEINDRHVAKFYPQYSFYKEAGRFKIYKYSTN